MKYKRIEYPVSIESAEDQLQLLLDTYEVDMLGLKEIDQGAFDIVDAQYKGFINHIRAGRLSVIENDCGVCIIQKLKFPIERKDKTISEITYFPLTSENQIAVDKYDRREEATLRYLAFMGSVSKLGADTIKKIKVGGDKKATDSVYSFFTMEL